MKKLCFVLLLCSLVNSAFAQTATLYATGASGSYTTGNTTTTTRTDNTMTVKNGSQRSYAVFNLSAAGIPTGSTINSATLTFVRTGYTAGSGTTTFAIYGNATNLSTVTTPATLYANIIAGTSMTTTTWGTSTGTTNLALNAGGLALLAANVSNTGFSIGWALAGTSTTRLYTITGETGGTSAPKLVINYTAPCSGAPAPGNTIASSTNVCNGFSTSLSLQNTIPGTGVSYQWKSAPDVSGAPGTYTSIGGAVSTTYNPTITSTIWYRCDVTCAASATTTSSNQIKVTMLPLPTAITGSATVCEGSSLTLSSTPGGGSWSSSSTGNATIDASLGIITGVLAGNTTIVYTAPDGCTTSRNETINVSPSPVTITPALSYTVCPATSVSPTASSNQPAMNLLYQDFNSGMTGAIGGTWTVVNTGSASPYNWSIVASPGTAYINGDYTPRMESYPDGITSQLITSLISPSFSTVGLTEADLSFNYYIFSSSYYDAAAEIDYSTDGGANWTLLYDYYNSTAGSYYWTAGTPDQTILLPAGALGQPNVQLRWYYNSTWGFYWQVDNISLSVPISALPGSAYTWTGISGATGLSCTNCASPNITPGAGGINNYSVTAVYNGCTRTSGVSVQVNAPGTFSGNAPMCMGGSGITLTNAVTGGTWSSASPGVASINAATGVVTPVAPGTASISYTLPPGCVASITVTVTAPPNTSSFSTSATNPCIGNTATVSTTSSLLAGTYNILYNLTGANSSAGNSAILVVSGGLASFATPALLNSGSTTVTITSITNSAGCTTSLSAGNTATLTVNPLPAAISGASSVCYGLTTTLTDAGGGTWTSNNATIAAVAPATGIVTGVAGGTTTITYTLPTGCKITTPITVNQTPAITGSTGACIGNTASVSDPTPGGTWSSGNVAVATINSSGVFTGVSLGSALISYTLPSTGCSAVQLVTITNPPAVFTVSGGGPYCPGSAGVPIGLSSSSVGFTYQLYLSGVATGFPVAGTGGAISFGIFNTVGTYTVKANPGTSCETSMAGVAVVSTYSLPTVYTVSGGGGYCTGASGVHIYLSGSNTGVAYQLFNGVTASGAPLSGTSAVLDFGSVTTAGTYTIKATDATSGCINTMTGSAVVTINPAPVAYSVTGGGAYCAGGAGVAVGLGNSAAGINYQLYRSGIAIGAPVAGIGGAITFGAQTIAGTYTVVATNTTTGCTGNMTGSATITIGSLPTVFNVTGGGAYCTGGTGVHIGLSGSAVGVNYQLYSGVLPFGAIIAGTGSAIDFGLITTLGTYTAVATSTSGSCTNTMLGSTIVFLNPAPVAFSVTGGGAYCSGTGGLHIGLSGSVIGTNYYLYNGATLLGGASGTGAPLDFGLEIPAGTYTINAAVAGTGCTGNMTGSGVITINPLPATFTVTGGGAYCAGSASPHVLISGSSATTTYQLYNGTTPAGAAITGTGSGFDFGAQAAAGTYTAVATVTATGCMNNMTGSAVVSINPIPSSYLVTGGGNYCAGGTGVHIGLISSDPGINYQLYLGVTPVGAPVPGTGAALDFGLKTAAGNYRVVATNATTSCIATMSGTVTIAINPLPASTNNVTGGGTYCAGSTGSDVGLDHSDAGINYQLYNSGIATGDAVGGSGTNIDFGLMTVAGIYTVIGTNAATGCSSNMTGSVPVSVSPLPVAYSVTGGGSHCPAGLGLHIGLINSASGVSYQLYLAGSPVGIAVSGTGSPIDFGTFTAPGIYTVEATNTTTTCSNTMLGSATISVSSLPVTYTVSGGGSFYCAGGTGVHVNLGGSEVGINYQLYRGGVLTGTPVAGTGLTIDFGAETLAGIYTVVATNPATGCTANMSGSAAVSVLGLPNIHVVTGGGNYCPGSGGSPVGLNGSEAGVNYQLFLDGSVYGSPVAGTGSTIDFGPQSNSGAYTVVAANPTTGCTADMTGAATVAISSLPVVFNISGSGSYCTGSIGLHILLDGSVSGNDYALYNGATYTGTTIAGTGSPLDFGLNLAGTYTIVATSAGTSCSNTMTGSAVISVNALPGTYNVTGGGSYCFGGTGVPVKLDGSDAGTNYTLSIAGSPLPASITGTGSALDFGLQTGTGIYSVVAFNSLTGCSNNMTGTVSINTNPLPVLYNVTGGGNYCTSGTGPSILLSGSTSGVSYELFNGTTLVSVPLFGTGLPLNFGAQTATGSYTIVGTDMGTGCTRTMTGSPAIGTLPLPDSYHVTGGGAICAGGTGSDVMLGNSVSGINYQLLVDGIPTGSIFSGTGSAINFGAQTVAGNYTVKATNPITGCTNTMIGSAPIVVGTVPVSYTVSGSSSTGYCSGGPGVSIYLSNSEAGVNYTLYRGTTAVGSPIGGTSGPLSFGAQTLTGTYTVAAVNTVAGCTSNMAGSVSVSINPQPAIYNVTGGGGFCAGSGAHIGLDGSSTGISYLLYHSGILAGPSVSGTGTGIDMGLQSVPGSYMVVAVNTSTGCISNMLGSATLYTNPAPVSYSVTGGGNFCTGGPGAHVGLNSSAIGFSYQLNNGSGPVGAAMTGTGASLDFGLQTVSGLYIITATNTTTGCTGNMTGSATINSYSLPNIHTVTGGGSYCSGDAGVNIGLNTSNSGISYRLYRGSTLVGLPVAGTGTAIDFGLQTAAGLYTVIAVDATTTCSSNMAGSASVSINPLPGVYPVTGGGAYCSGTGGVHIGLASSSSGISYNLYNGTSLSGTLPGSGTILDFGAQTVAGSYTVKATDYATGCMSIMPGTAAVAVNPVLVPSVNISTASGDTVCSGNMTTFTAMVTNGGSSPAYQWSVNGIPSGTAINYNYVPADGDIVSIAITSNATCAIPSTASATATITVLDKHSPSVTISANPGVEVCQGASVSFTATAAYGGTVPIFEWRNGTTVISSGPTYTYVPANGDVITCKLTSNYLCRLANYAMSAPSAMITDIAVTPIVSISAYPDLSISKGETETLVATVTYGGPSPAFQWNINGADIAGATSSSFSSSQFNNGDIITCKVVSSGGCSGIPGGSSITINVIGVGVQPVNAASDDIWLLPNPNNGTFTIKGMVSSIDEEVSFEVTNMLGQVIYSNKIIANGGQLNEKVQLGNSVANGMYLVNLHTATGNKVFHLVIEQ